MNPVQYERLQNLIAQSPLLTPTERAEWASLLVVMNDKQITELEQILLSPADMPAKPAAPATPPHIQAEPIPADPAPVLVLPKPASASHARVPFSGVIMNPPHIGSTPVGGEKPFAAVPVSPATPLPAPRPIAPAPVGSTPRPVAAPIPAPVATVPPVAARNSAIEAVVEDAAPITSEQPHLETFSSLADVAKLTLAYFRSHLVGELQQQLHELVLDNGYFAVREELAKSPLFHTYIQSGLLLLSGQNLSQQFLSRAEWETMADMLASLRRN